MPHEIYYTSAPQGVRHGQQGFCTVATSAGIPKPLWDRLESVSGYRHPFGSSPGRSPVSWAHWLIQVSGKEVSVLSRICDAGMDYTQRTNSFAHHLALEPEERAAAGPAWMLRRDGLMVRQWDGRVGDIPRTSPVPRGDSPPTPCNGWKQITGDAGWAGVLAETAVRNPRKPVCLLFNPGVDLLPLIAESIALLPVRLRWQVTFNTYFTSVPGNAVCAWRCCVVNSPAAQETMRQSAGSLVLDLSRPAQLGAPPAGPWVDAARAGRTGAAEVLTPTPAFLKPLAARTPATPRRAEPKLPPLPVALAELLPSRPPALPVSAPTDPSAGLGVVNTTDAGEVIAPAELPWRPNRSPRRVLLMVLCGLAIILVGVGTWLRLRAEQDSSEHALTNPQAPAVIKPEHPASSEETSAPLWPFGGPTTQPRPDEPSKTVGSALPATAPVTALVETPQPVAPTPPVAPLPPAPPPLAPPESSVKVELADSLRQPALGAGVGDAVQRIPIPPHSLARVRPLESVQLEFSGRQTTYRLSGDELAGELSIVSAPARRHDLVWRDAANPTAPVGVASIVLEQGARQMPQVVVAWKPAVLLNRPGIAALTRGVLQNATIVATGRNGKACEYTFRPPDPVDINIGELHVSITTPPVPPGVALAAERGLGYEWNMTAVQEWEAGLAHRAENAGWVMHFKGPPIGPHSPNEFDVHLAPGWTSAGSTWATQRKGLAAAESASSEELKRVSAQADEQRSYVQTAMEPLQKDVQEATSMLSQTDEQLSAVFTSRAQVQKRLEAAKATLIQQRARLDEASSSIMVRHAEAERNHGVLAAAIKALDDVKDVEVWAELPGGLRTVGFRLVREGEVLHP